MNDLGRYGGDSGDSRDRPLTPWERINEHRAERDRYRAEHVDEILADLDEVRREARERREARIAGGEQDQLDTTEDEPGEQSEADDSDKGLRISEDERTRAREYLDGFTSPRDNPRGGHPTRGVWWDEHGAGGTVESGRDEDSAAVRKLLRERGLKRPLTLPDHVEAKLAARMHETGVRHAVVMINNDVCRGTGSCDAWLPSLLAEGSTIRVLQHNGETKLYEGTS